MHSGMTFQHHQPPTELISVQRRTDDLVRELQGVDDTQEKVVVGSRALLLFARDKARGVSIWRQQVVTAAHSHPRQLLGLFYVANDVLLSTAGADNWPDYFVSSIHDTLSAALQACEHARDRQTIDRLARLPGIWRERRIFQHSVCETLAELFTPSTAQHMPRREAPTALACHQHAQRPEVKPEAARGSAPLTPRPETGRPPALANAPVHLASRGPAMQSDATLDKTFQEAVVLLLAVRQREHDKEFEAFEKQNTAEVKSLFEIQANKMRLCAAEEKESLQVLNARQWEAVQEDHREAAEILRMRFANQMTQWRSVVQRYVDGLRQTSEAKHALEATIRTCRRAEECSETANALLVMIKQAADTASQKQDSTQLNSSSKQIHRPPQLDREQAGGSGRYESGWQSSSSLPAAHSSQGSSSGPAVRAPIPRAAATTQQPQTSTSVHPGAAQAAAPMQSHLAGFRATRAPPHVAHTVEHPQQPPALPPPSHPPPGAPVHSTHQPPHPASAPRHHVPAMPPPSFPPPSQSLSSHPPPRPSAHTSAFATSQAHSPRHQAPPEQPSPPAQRSASAHSPQTPGPQPRSQTGSQWWSKPAEQARAEQEQRVGGRQSSSDRVIDLMGALQQLQSKLSPVRRSQGSSTRTDVSAPSVDSAEHSAGRAGAAQGGRSVSGGAGGGGSARPSRRSAQEPSFECDICGKSFRVRFYQNALVAKGARDQHIKAVHGRAAALQTQDSEAASRARDPDRQDDADQWHEDVNDATSSIRSPTKSSAVGGHADAAAASVVGGVDSDAMFIPAAHVIQQGSGKLDGYVLKVGPKGLGYYKIVKVARGLDGTANELGEGEKSARQKENERTRKSLSDIIKNRCRLDEESRKQAGEASVVEMHTAGDGMEENGRDVKAEHADDVDQDQDDVMEIDPPGGSAVVAANVDRIASSESQPLSAAPEQDDEESGIEDVEDEDEDDELEEGEVREVLTPRRRRARVQSHEVASKATAAADVQDLEETSRVDEIVVEVQREDVSTGQIRSEATEQKEAAMDVERADATERSEEKQQTEAAEEQLAAARGGEEGTETREVEVDRAADIVSMVTAEKSERGCGSYEASGYEASEATDSQHKLPLTVGATQILSLGELSRDPAGYYTNKVVFPVGFCSARVYTSLHDRHAKVRHVSEVLPGPEFVVRVEADPPYEYRGATPTQPWLQAMMALHKRHGMRVNQHISGLTMFGFGNNRVLALLKTLPGYQHYDKAIRQPSPPPQLATKKVRPALSAGKGPCVVDPPRVDAESDVDKGASSEMQIEVDESETPFSSATEQRNDFASNIVDAAPTDHAARAEGEDAAAVKEEAEQEGGGELGADRTQEMSKFTRHEIKAGQGLLDLFEYYFVADQQARAPPALQPIEEGMRVKAKWLAMEGGVVWYDGVVQHVNPDGSADVLYDDGDVENGVQRRHLQPLKGKALKKRASEEAELQPTAAASKKRKGNASAAAPTIESPKSSAGAWRSELEGLASEEVLKFMQRSMALTSLPAPNPTDPLAECAAVVGMVARSKAAEGLLEAPPALRRLTLTHGKSQARMPLDLGGVLQKLERRGKGQPGRYGYKTAQQVREDAVRVLVHARAVHGERSAVWGRARRLVQALTALFRARILPGLHQGMERFEHGEQWLGQKVRVYWEDDMCWYTAIIDDHDGQERYHLIYEDDGMEEWMELPSIDVHLISSDWSPPTNGRLLEPGDLALCDPDPSPNSPGLLYHAQVADVDVQAGSVFVEFSNWGGREGSWVIPEYARLSVCDDSPLARIANGVCLTMGESDSVRQMAKRLGVDESKLLLLNKISFPDLALSSKLRKGTTLMLPLEEASRRRTWPDVPPDEQGATRDESREPEMSDEGGLCARVWKEGACGVMRMRDRRVRGERFGRMAVKVGADAKLLGAQVVVDCVNSRHLGVITSFDPQRGEYRVKLDCDWVDPGLGKAYVDGGLWTPMPCSDVSVVADPDWRYDEDWLVEGGMEANVKRPNVDDTRKVIAAEPKLEEVDVSEEAPPEDARMELMEVVQEQDKCQTDVVGLKVVREFDGMAGTVATVIPGGDVVVVEWEDGDCEDMHLSDMVERGMVDLP